MASWLKELVDDTQPDHEDGDGQKKIQEEGPANEWVVSLMQQLAQQRQERISTAARVREANKNEQPSD